MRYDGLQMNFSRNSKYFILVVGVGIMIMLAVGLKTRITLLQDLNKEAEAVDTKVAALEATRSLLQTEIAYATSDAAVEEWAYTEARMVREGDNLVVPISAQKTTPTPSAPIIDTPNPMENWEAWRALFFDSSLP